MNKAIVLIIDDEPQMRRLLRIVLESNGYKVVEAGTAHEGIHLAASHRPELILLDIGLPDQNGQEVLKHLRTWYSKAVIMLSVQDAEEDIVVALDNGATDYLTKPFRTGELLARIRASIRLYQNEESELEITANDLNIDLVKRQVLLNGKPVKLTQTEYNLLVLLAKHKGKVLTHQYLLTNIWGAGANNETQYLRVFIAQLRKKLEANPNAPAHIITESGVGYRFL